MKIRIECCKNCTDERHVGCHATCKKYIDESTEMHKDKERDKAQARLHAFIMDGQIGRYDKQAKYRKRRGRI